MRGNKGQNNQKSLVQGAGIIVYTNTLLFVNKLFFLLVGISSDQILT
jgi:hypothetical protein